MNIGTTTKRAIGTVIKDIGSITITSIPLFSLEKPLSTTDEPAPPEMEPISIVPFKELSLPGSHPIALAYGAFDAKRVAYFSAGPFGQGVLDEAIRGSRKSGSEHVSIIAHQDHHLVPISWLMIQVPRQQPLLKRVQNRIKKEAKITKRAAQRVRDPEIEPF